MNVKKMEIKDDMELLDMEISEAKKVPEIYKPTNYWLHYVDDIVINLKKDGMKALRNKPSSVYSVFGGSDYQLDYFRVKKKGSFPPTYFFDKYYTVWSAIPKENLQTLAYQQAYYLDKKYNVNKLNELSVSLVGNPMDVFYIEEKPYTINFLNYFIQYIYLCRFIDFNKIKVFIDLGCGLSKVTEIIHRLHPHVMILLFDIVPTVYTIEMYWKSLFGDSVKGYREVKDLKELKYDAGKVYVFPNWMIPIIKTMPVDVFMNSGSFQEMEKNVVDNYLSFVNGNARYVYLRAKMTGNEKAKHKGDYGSIEPVKKEVYLSSLSNYDIVDNSPSIFSLLVKSGYEDILFERENL